MKRLTILIALLLASPLYGANEVVFNYGTTGLTLYFVDFNASGQAWDTTGTPAYETFTTTRGDYDIALTEVSGTGLYRGSLPAQSGQHYWSIYLQAGGSPSATDDVLIGAGSGYFDGSTLGDAVLVADIAAVTTSGGGPFLNEIPEEPFRSKLTTRRDGTASVDRPCRVQAGESVVWAVDCSALLRGGRTLDEMSEPAEAENAELSVGTTAGTNYGVNQQYAMVKVIASGAATGTGEVTFTVEFGNNTLVVMLPVKVL